MAAQTYTVLFPVNRSGVQYNQGDTLSLDDADSNTLALLAEKTIALTSDGGTAALLVTDEADSTTQAKGPGQANTPLGEFD